MQVNNLLTHEIAIIRRKSCRFRLLSLTDTRPISVRNEERLPPEHISVLKTKVTPEDDVTIIGTHEKSFLARKCVKSFAKRAVAGEGGVSVRRSTETLPSPANPST